MKHLSEEQLSALLDDALSPDRRAEAERHLAACAACRDALAALTAQDKHLQSALSHDPGDAYFASFAARVEQRIRAAGPAGSRGAAPRRGALAWLWGPSGMRWAGATAAIVVAAGVVFFLGREGRLESPARPNVLRERAEQTAPAAPSEPSPLPRSQDLANERGVADALRDRAVPEAGNDRRVATKVDSKLRASEMQSGAKDKQELAKEGAAAGRMTEARQTPEGDEIPARTKEPAFAPAPTPVNPPVDEVQRKNAARSVKPQAMPLGQSSPTFAQPEAQKRADRPALDAARPPTAGSPTEEIYRFTPPSTAGAVAARLCGVVRDATGRPIPHANVVAADARAAAAQTDEAGHFCLDAGTRGVTLAVYAMGYHPGRYAVPASTGAREVAITLEPIQVLLGTRQPAGRLEIKTPGATVDSFATWPAVARALARRAQENARLGTEEKSAASFDESAHDWQRAIQVLGDRPEQLVARERLADVTFKALELEPTRARAQAAEQALDELAERLKGAAEKREVEQKRTQIRALYR